MFDIFITIVRSHLVSAVIALPALGALAVALIPSRAQQAIRWVALLAGLATTALAGFVISRVHGTGELELVETAAWMPTVGIHYRVGVDGASAMLIGLTALLAVVAILVSWKEIDRRLKLFHGLLLLTECALLGVFSAIDLFLFFLFWEAVLVPMTFLIGIWGGEGRLRAATKFLIFTMAGSVFLLVAILYAGSVCGSFDLVDWLGHRFSVREQLWLLAAFSVGFGVKVPLLGLHTWLPDAHTEAPTAGSVMLAGVLLKMGAYGFFRIAMPMAPVGVAVAAPVILALAVAAIVAGALLAMVQPDLKRLIAYSSISHMGFVMLGLWALEPSAVAGAVLAMVNHGLITGGLFLMVGMMTERRDTRMIADYGGTARSLPLLAAAFLFLTLATIGLPGLAGFSGEFLVLLGSFQTRTPYAAAAIAGVVLLAAAFLWAIQRIFMGPLVHEEERRMPDLMPREAMLLAPLVALIVLIGVWPQAALVRLIKPADAFVAMARRVEMVVPATTATPEIFVPVPILQAPAPAAGSGALLP